MDLVYRVSTTDHHAVVGGLRAQGFDAAVCDVVVGRDHGAVVVHGVADAAEAKVADSVVQVIDRTGERVGTG